MRFFPSHCGLQDRESGVMIVHAKISNELYFLDISLSFLSKLLVTKFDSISKDLDILLFLLLRNLIVEVCTVMYVNLLNVGV